MALTLTTTCRDALANALKDAILVGTGTATIKIENVSDTALATFNLDATTPFGAASSGVITMSSQPKTDSTAVAGTAVQFSLFNEGGTKLLEGSCGTSGQDIVISSTAIGAGDTVELTTMTFTMPAS